MECKGSAAELRAENKEFFDHALKRYLDHIIPVLCARARVAETIIQAMIAHKPVPREEARLVLWAFSSLTGRTATLETVELNLLPARKWSMMDLRSRHHFDIVALANRAGVDPQIVYYMLLKEPVPRQSAIAVLTALSEWTGKEYSLENVAVNILLQSQMGEVNEKTRH